MFSWLCRAALLLICVLTVTACESPRYTPPPARPFGADNDYDACIKRCNRRYDRCEDRGEARSKQFLFFDTVGGGAGCRKDLRECLDTCTSRIAEKSSGGDNDEKED